MQGKIEFKLVPEDITPLHSAMKNQTRKKELICANNKHQTQYLKWPIDYLVKTYDFKWEKNYFNEESKSTMNNVACLDCVNRIRTSTRGGGLHL